LNVDHFEGSADLDTRQLPPNDVPPFYLRVLGRKRFIMQVPYSNDVPPVTRLTAEGRLALDGAFAICA
jgi:hypothetical protein